MRLSGENEKGTVEVPIIAMTGQALEGDREHCLGMGMNDYLTRPINKNQVLEIVGKWSR